MVGQERQDQRCYRFDESIATVKDYIQKGEIIADNDLEVEEETDEEKKLPIVGILGFSQGAAFGGLIAHKFPQWFETDPLKFVVLYSGFKLDTSKKTGNDKYNEYYPKQKTTLKMEVSSTFMCWESWTQW